MGNQQSSNQNLSVSYDKSDAQNSSLSKKLDSTNSLNNFNKPPKKIQIQKIGQLDSNKYGIICCGKQTIEQNWLNHLYEELDSESERQWCQQLSQNLKFFKGYTANYYQRELQWVFFAYQDKHKLGLANYKPSIYKALNNNDSTDNNLSKIDEHNEVFFESQLEKSQLLNQQEIQEQTQTEAEEKCKLKKLLKQSYIIEEDFHTENQLKMSNSANISQVFNSMKASTQSANVPSFIYQNVHNQKKEDPSNKDYIRQLDLYVKLMAKIKKHIKDENCILNFIMSIFYRTYIKQYQKCIQECEQLETITQKEQQVIEEGINDLQQFIRIFQEVVVQFYNLVHSELKKNVPLFSRDNVLNFITSVVFDEQELYETIFGLQKLLDKQQNQLLENAMKTGLILNQNDMFIPPKFHLNENTRNYLIQKGKITEKKIKNTIEDQKILQNQEKQQLKLSQEQNDIIDDLPQVSDIIHLVKKDNQIEVEMKSNQEYSIEEQRGSMTLMEQISNLKGTKKEIAIYNILKKDPYYDSIRTLMKIKKRNSPVSKMRVILKSSEHIMKAINKYYNSVGATFNNIIDSDDLLSIFNYITLKSNITDLSTHCTVIERFSTNSILNAISGFYLTTLQASIDYLQNNITQSFIDKKDQKNEQ